MSGLLVSNENQIFFPQATYEELVAQKLATKSVNETKGLTTYKYAKRVMFDNLWDSHPALMECRGITFDSIGRLIALPVRKSFNYLESGWWSQVALNAKVVLYKKYNGFMACLSDANDGSQIISTTGSTKSDYVALAKKKLEFKSAPFLGSTLYEVVDQFDPHIVAEKIGVYNLGWRCSRMGNFHPHGEYVKATLEEAVEIAEHDRGEGFMVYLEEDEYKLSPCKLKTPYYVGKKRLMRMGQKEIGAMYSGQTPARLGKDWENIVPFIRAGVPMETWTQFGDQTRRAVLEHYWSIEKG